MICKNCGTQLDEGSRFCTECGTPVEAEQAHAVSQSSLEPGHSNSIIKQNSLALDDDSPAVESKTKKPALLFPLIGAAALVIIIIIVISIAINSGNNTTAPSSSRTASSSTSGQQAPAPKVLETVYVSAKGNSSNTGSESQPLDFDTAMARVYDGTVKEIIIIGTLTASDVTPRSVAVFRIAPGNNASREILITGKPNASATERAVLSGKDSSRAVMEIAGAKVRLEHIELSGGERGDFYGYGLRLGDGAEVTLGQGVVIRDNRNDGIFAYLSDGTCTIDGAEISGNGSDGIANNGTLFLRSGSIKDNYNGVSSHGQFTMSGGTISGNRNMGVSGRGNFIMTGGTISNNTSVITDDGGGVRVNGNFTMSGGTITNNSAKRGAGVYVASDIYGREYGSFTMSGGTITNNRASVSGGGVFVVSGGSFEQTGGSISSNTAPQGADIYRQ